MAGLAHLPATVASGGSSLLVYSSPSAPTARARLRFDLSTDGGISWRSGPVLWPQLAGYSDLVQGHGGTAVGVLFENGEQTFSDRISFASVSKAWLLQNGGLSTTLKTEDDQGKAEQRLASSSYNEGSTDATAVGCPVPPPSISGNMVANPNFQRKDSNGIPCEWGASGPFSRSTNVTLPGSAASLHYHGTDPKVYTIVKQHVAVVPGVTYRFSASIRTQNLTGGNGYASIIAMWLNTVNATSTGKKYGGSYPSGVAGTSGWEKVAGTVVLPANLKAGSFAIGLYARPYLQNDPTPTGDAWWDNISMTHAPPRPLQSVLVSPVYRGRVQLTSDSVTSMAIPDILIRAAFVFDAATVVPTLQVQLALRSRPIGKHVWKSSAIMVSDPSQLMDINVSAMMLAAGAPRLVPGEYSIDVTCLKATRRITQGSSNAMKTTAVAMVTDSHNLTVVAPVTVGVAPPLVAIDEQSRVIINGSEAFFPMGMYGFCGSGISTLSNATAMQMMADAGYNAIMPYGECNEAELDSALAHNIKVAYSLKDIFSGNSSYQRKNSLRTGAEEETHFKARLAQYRAHPAVFAWYLNDEILSTDPRLRTHQQWVIEGDSDHPTWSVDTALNPGYLGTADAFGVDSCECNALCLVCHHLALRLTQRYCPQTQSAC